MNWAHTKLDRLLGWYAAQPIWTKILCVLPVVLGVGVLVCVCLVTLRGASSRKCTTAEAIHAEAATVIASIDKRLRESAIKVKQAQERQEVISARLDQARAGKVELRTRVDDMTHEELKLFMERAKLESAAETTNAVEWGEYQPAPERLTYGVDSEGGIPFHELKSKVKKQDK